MLAPTDCIRSFSEFDIGVISARTGRDPEHEWAVTVDIDGYIAGHHDDYLPERALRKFEELGADPRIKALGAISNAGKDRYERAHFLTGLGAEAAQKEVFCTTSHEVGSGKFRKQIFVASSEAMGVEPEDVVHGGDQLVKDVWGAKRAGFGATVLGTPYRIHHEHPLTHALQRPFEAGLRPLIGLPFRADDFGLIGAPVELYDLPVLEMDSESYRKMKQVYFTAAATLALNGIADLAIGQGTGEVFAAAFSEITALGLVGYGLAAYKEQLRHVFEEFDSRILVGDEGLEPPTSSLSVTRSNQLS